MTTPIVYIPGWGCDGDLFTETTTALAAEAPQQVIDLRGTTSLEQMITATVEQLPASCHLVGMSMGGWVAQCVAAQRPETISRLVLGSTWTRAPDTFLAALRESVDFVGGGPSREELKEALLPNFSERLQAGAMPDRMLAMIERVGTPSLLSQAAAMLNRPDVSDSLQQLRCPTLVLAGADDIFFSPTLQRSIALELIDADRVQVGFEVVADANHNITWEAPEQVAEALRRWLLGDQPLGVAPTRG